MLQKRGARLERRKSESQIVSKGRRFATWGRRAFERRNPQAHHRGEGAAIIAVRRREQKRKDVSLLSRAVVKRITRRDGNRERVKIAKA